MAFLATLTLAVVTVFWVILRVDHQARRDASPVGWQAADAPPAGSTPHDPWLDPPDAWADAALPVATLIGPAVEESSEVHAVADGLVVFAGMRDGEAAVILGHRNRDGEKFESVYSPLAAVNCRAGELVGRGMLIGRLGEQPLDPVLRSMPPGVEEVSFGKSALAEALASPGLDGWMSLEIGNAEQMLKLLDESGD